MPTENQHADNLNAARGNDQEPSQQESAPPKETPHQSNLWPLVFATSISCDAIDLIPVAGPILTFPFRPLIFIFILKQKSKKSNVFSCILLALDFVPIISMAPLGTVAVFRAWRQSKNNV